MLKCIFIIKFSAKHHCECPLGILIKFLDVEFSLLFCLGNIELFFAQLYLGYALNERLKSSPLMIAG